jgi:hypothetical protein
MRIRATASLPEAFGAIHASLLRDLPQALEQ